MSEILLKFVAFNKIVPLLELVILLDKLEPVHENMPRKEKHRYKMSYLYSMLTSDDPATVEENRTWL